MRLDRYVWGPGVVCLLVTVACDVYDANPDTPARERAPARPHEDFAREAPIAGSGSCPASVGSAQASCHPTCSEQCNGRDDDCDEAIDEVSADASCSAPYADTVCRTGDCLITGCRAERRDCDHLAWNGCEVGADDPENCGACGNQCELEHGRSVCIGGRCALTACHDGFADCDRDGASCETPLDTALDCGECGHACPSLLHAQSQCEAGACGPVVCDTGYADCNGTPSDGCEQALGTVAACGDCGTPCRFASEAPHARAACESSVCRPRCGSGYADCDGVFANGCERALNTLADCGECGRVCEVADATATCDAFRCEVETCHAGYADCDGDGVSCETRLDTAEHCGNCFVACSFPNAIAACGGSPEAQGCVLAACEPGFEDCDGDAANGCERDLRSPADGGAGPCLPESDCELTSRNGHDYYVCPGELGWAEARVACQRELRGDLVMIDSDAEADFVQTLLRRELHWVGFTDLAIEGLWMFARNNVPFWRAGVLGIAFDGFLVRWGRGEPDGSGDCAAITGLGLFEDLNCTIRSPFVCEVEPDTCPDDPAKVDPGQCGCGVADTDRDRDGFAECSER